jgi:hypothetical protein
VLSVNVKLAVVDEVGRSGPVRIVGAGGADDLWLTTSPIATDTPASTPRKSRKARIRLVLLLCWDLLRGVFIGLLGSGAGAGDE